MSEIRILNEREKEVLKAVVEEELSLARQLLDSYRSDLATLEASTSIPDTDKSSRREFLQKAIKESEQLYNLRKRQSNVLNSKKTEKNGRKSAEIITRVWNDSTLMSKGMDAIMKESEDNSPKTQANDEVAEKSEALNSAFSAISAAARKVADEKTQEPNKYLNIEGSNKWNLATKSKNNDAFIYTDSVNSKITYMYIPEINEVLRTEPIGGKILHTYYDFKSGSWNQVPQVALDDHSLHYDSNAGKWRKYDFESKKWVEPKKWFIPILDSSGKYIRDRNGKVKIKEVTEEEFEKMGENSLHRLKKDFEKPIDLLKDEDDEIEVTPIVQELPISFFQKIKRWFIRLFNKNYEIPGSKVTYYLPKAQDEILRQERPEEGYDKNLGKDDIEKAKQKDNAEKEKRKLANKPSNKKEKLKDENETLIKTIALETALIIAGVGFVPYNEYTKNQVERKAYEAKQQDVIEIQKEEEKQQSNGFVNAQARNSVEEQENEAQEQINETQEQAEDVLIEHDANSLTTGSVLKQYLVPKGIEYTASSTGKGARGTFDKNTVVEVYNRAIVKENEDGTKDVLISANGKTWEDYSKDSGISVEQISDMLQEDGVYEMDAIQVAGTNHHIVNTYGWVRNDELQESSRGTEKLLEFYIGDNTEILQKLQNQERANSDGEVNVQTQEER